jgi:hypothetical protein
LRQSRTRCARHAWRSAACPPWAGPRSDI